MMRRGHAGITFGLVGFGSAIWMRQRLSDRLDYLSKLDREQVPSVRERVARRAPLALAATTVTGTAVLTSGNLDGLERALFGPGGHRETGHSLLYALCFKKSLDGVVDRFQNLAERLCETWGLNETDLIQKTSQAIADLVKFISDGAFYGHLTHVLGDIPTSGTGGVSALKALTPLLETNLSIGLIKASSPLWNRLFWKAGLIIGAGSLITVGVYTVTPKPPSEVVKNKIKKARELRPEVTFETVAPLVRALPEMTAKTV